LIEVILENTFFRNWLCQRFRIKKADSFWPIEPFFEFDAQHRTKKMEKSGRKVAFFDRNGSDLTSYFFSSFAYAAQLYRFTLRNRGIGPARIITTLYHKHHQTITTMNMLSSWMLIGATALMLASCGTSETAVQPNLEDTRWLLREMHTNGNHQTAPDSVQITLRFLQAGRFSTFGTCNNLSGLYNRADPDKLTFTNGVSTEIACAILQSWEVPFFATLNIAQTYEVDGNQLIINGKDDSQLVFDQL
jgi:heat shock protein HslJ